MYVICRSSLGPHRGGGPIPCNMGAMEGMLVGGVIPLCCDLSVSILEGYAMGDNACGYYTVESLDQ